MKYIKIFIWLSLILFSAGASAWVSDMSECVDDLMSAPLYCSYNPYFQAYYPPYNYYPSYDSYYYPSYGYYPSPYLGVGGLVGNNWGWGASNGWNAVRNTVNNNDNRSVVNPNNVTRPNEKSNLNRTPSFVSQPTNRFDSLGSDNGRAPEESHQVRPYDANAAGQLSHPEGEGHMQHRDMERDQPPREEGDMREEGHFGGGGFRR